MRTRLALRSGPLAAFVLLFLTMGPYRSGHAASGRIGIGRGTRSCPYVVPFQQVKMEIVEIMFTDEVPGVNGNRMRLTGERKKKYRLGVVAIKVQKPAGMRLSVAAADFTIHYYHGDQTEVAPCEGISTFSSTLDVDRPMMLPRMQGPGWVKQTTGARCTQASVVYIDAVFALMEPDTRECWICVAQPTTTRAYVSRGWRR